MSARLFIKKAGKLVERFCAALLLFAMAACGSASSSNNNGSYYIGEGKVPWSMALNEDESLLYVANSVANTVEVLETATMKSVAIIPVLCNPRGLAFNSDYTKLYVSHDNQSYCKNSQTSYLQRSDGWASVISIADKKVVTEIDLNTTSGYVQNPRDVIYYHDPSKPVTDFSSDAVFFTGYYYDKTNPANSSGKTEIINANTDTASAMYPSDAYPPAPYRVRLDTSRNLMYILDAYTQAVAVKKLMSPQNNIFADYTYNGQTQGYCGGYDNYPDRYNNYNRKNNCACTESSQCNSGSCDKTGILPYCESVVGTNEEMVSKLILSDASYNIKIRGICDPSTKLCEATVYESSQDEYMKCINPYDILPMNDGTMYVTCNGGNDEDERDDEQYVFRVLIDDDGLANTGYSVVSPTSDKICPQPTDLATDPDQNYVFVACFKDRYLAIIDGHTGEYIGRKELPGPPVDIVASKDYVFVSTSSANQIMKFAINPLRN